MKARKWAMPISSLQNVYLSGENNINLEVWTWTWDMRMIRYRHGYKVFLQNFGYDMAGI